MQTDPIGYEDQMNLYAYVHNDPLNYTDPSGEQSAAAAESQNLARIFNSDILDRPDFQETQQQGDEGVLMAAALMVPLGEVGVAAISARLTQAVRTASTTRQAGRGKNRLQPDREAEGPHSTYKSSSDGNTSNYATYRPNSRNPTGFQETKRVDVTGRPHRNPDGEIVPTPHVKEAGTRGVRPARPDELP